MWWWRFGLRNQYNVCYALRWRHNERDGVSKYQPNDWLLKPLFGRISKKTSKLCVTGLCVGNSPGPVNSPHKGPVTRKMFPFNDVIMVTDHGSTCQLFSKTRLYNETFHWRQVSVAMSQITGNGLFAQPDGGNGNVKICNDLWERNSAWTGGFPSQRASSTESVITS